jgi:hypothetical protein
MGDQKYLTAEEVSERYRGAVRMGTLRNWRAMRVGPTFVKVGKAVLYPIDEHDADRDARGRLESARAIVPPLPTPPPAQGP